MERRLALPALAALGVSSLFGSLTLPAAGDVAKPGTIVTVAGTGAPGYAGDNGPARQAQLRWPAGVALDGAGNVFIAEWDNNRVRKVDAVTGIITTVAGTGQPGFSGDGGLATDAQLNGPLYPVVDRSGNLFISDLYNHRVRRVDAVTGIITTYAGSGPVDTTTTHTADPRTGGFSGDNGPAAGGNARLDGPIGLAVDAHGNLFIGDYYNRRVRKVDAVTGIITTVAGNGHPGYSGDNGPATEAGMSPGGLAVDSEGDLFITDNPFDTNLDTYRVRRVDAVTGIITTVVGTGKAGFTGDAGQATDARLNYPVGLAVDSAGSLFVADRNNYRVRKVSPEGMITTVAGVGKKLYAGDGGLATETGLRGPWGLAIDPVGNLLISDNGSSNGGDGLPASDRVLKVFGIGAPGLLAGAAFPMPKQP